MVDTLNVGDLDLNGYDYALSRQVVKHHDLPARDCPTTFHSINGEVEVGAPSVRVITRQNLQYYRYFHIEGKTMGCRGWTRRVIQEFRQAGLLARADRAAGRVDDLFFHQHDRYLRTRSIPFFPGLFRDVDAPAQGTMTSSQQMSDHLRSVDNQSIDALATVGQSSEGGWEQDSAIASTWRGLLS